MSNTIAGFKELARSLKNLGVKTRKKIARRGIAKMSQVVRKEMRRQAPPKRTGKLHKNLKWSIKQNPKGGFVARVGAFNDAFYAKFIEGGTKAHRIPSKSTGRGRNRRANTKKVSFAAGEVYSKVNHPGTKAQPFIEKSLRAAQDRAVKEAGEIMFKLIKESFK